MTDIEASGANADQIEFWNSGVGEEWATNNDQQDEMLRPIGLQAINVADPKPGETALDIGCGCGDTSFELLSRVGPTGQVMGVDVSKPMTNRALERADALPPELKQKVSFELADASTYDFRPASTDLLFSRFGVMFFSDPGSAFAHMRQALKPGGRMTFICWRSVAENEWVHLAMSAALEHLPPPEAMDPNAPGPFAFQDKDRLTGILADAGFRDIAVEPFNPDMKLASLGGPETAATFIMERGPLVRLVEGQDDETLAKVKASVVKAVEPHYKDDFITLSGGCWIVSAVNP